MKYKNLYVENFYSPFINFEEKTKAFLEYNLFLPKIEEFFENKKILDYSSLNNKYLISDILFNEIAFDYIYKEIFKDINKKDNLVKFKIKYSITFDKKLTNKECSITGIHYSELKIHREPFFYILYIDSFENILIYIKEKVERTRNFKYIV